MRGERASSSPKEASKSPEKAYTDVGVRRKADYDGVDGSGEGDDGDGVVGSGGRAAQQANNTIYEQTQLYSRQTEKLVQK